MAPVIYDVAIPEAITVSELAQKMSLKATDLLKYMIKMGIMAAINQVLDQQYGGPHPQELGHRQLKVIKVDALHWKMI